ncbi:MAG: hypothetical protein ACJA0E_001533, partial [Bermanella sp.]
KKFWVSGTVRGLIILVDILDIMKAINRMTADIIDNFVSTDFFILFLY